MKKPKFNQLEVIKEKFLAFEENAKNYQFIPVVIEKEIFKCVFIKNRIRDDEYIHIVLNILDNKGYNVVLYAQASESGKFLITDEGLIAQEYRSQGKASLFSNFLWLKCKLDQFDEKMQDYFYMLSTLFNFLGFKWDQKNEALQNT